MSSEESDSEGVILHKRPLPWLKSKYSNSLHLLDTLYFRSLSKKSKGMVRQREDGEPSERPAPLSPLPYALVVDENLPLSVALDSSISGSENFE